MTPTNTIPVQALLYQHQSGKAGHSTRKQGNATETAFADYGFGPANTGDRAKSDLKPAAGTYGTSQHAMPWVAQVQSAPGVAISTTADQARTALTTAATAGLGSVSAGLAGLVGSVNAATAGLGSSANAGTLAATAQTAATGMVQRATSWAAQAQAAPGVVSGIK